MRKSASILVLCAPLALAACGADEVVGVVASDEVETAESADTSGPALTSKSTESDEDAEAVEFDPGPGVYNPDAVDDGQPENATELLALERAKAGITKPGI